MNEPALLGIALLFGLVHAAHCAGMCGPFAVMATSSRGAGGLVAYAAGKTFTYVFLGALVGAAGSGLLARAEGLADGLGLAVGVALVVSGALRLWRAPAPGTVGRGLTALVARTVGTLQPGPNLSGRFTLGALTGAIPCGVVYLALLQAAATARPATAAVFMAVFGLGTIPALAAVATGGRWLARSWNPHRLRIAGGSLILVAGLITLWRTGLPGIDRFCEACFR